MSIPENECPRCGMQDYQNEDWRIGAPLEDEMITVFECYCPHCHMTWEYTQIFKLVDACISFDEEDMNNG